MMTAEYILRAAVRSIEQGRKPNCFSAHVPGKGYTNRGETAADDMADYTRQAVNAAQSEVDSMLWATEYAEPGYTQPKRGVMFANWNNFPSKVGDLLERMGYACEWSDEWSLCDGCSKAVRTSGNSYSWRAAFYVANECEIICHECVTADPAQYVEGYLLNNADRADTMDVDLDALGFVRFNDDTYEHGFHQGQNDTPKEVVEHLPADHDFVFQIPSVGQFDIRFNVWVRPQQQD